jgi:quercetin dioxygenase-like cupin family protein
VVNPYSEHVSGNTRIRTFGADVEDHELIWHRDHHDRVVEVVAGTGWQFQYDNQPPREMHVGQLFHIPRGTYHRLIKGESTLVLEITEHETGTAI